MPVDIDNMRSEVSIQSASAHQSQSATAPAAIDQDQLRETIRELVMEIVGDDIYSLFRLRGL